MFSSFGAATQSSSPANNPFATKASTSVSNPFASTAAGSINTATSTTTTTATFPKATGPATQGKRKGFGFPSDSSDNDTKRKGVFGKNPSLQDGGSSFEQKKKGGNGPHNGDLKPPKQSAKASRKSGFGSDNATTDASLRPASSSGSNSDDDEVPQQFASLPNSTDPHAIRVYTQLRKDGIAPPSWPSQPGAPASSAAMSKFRDQYEKYRSRVRKSLTKAGLIDDPNKRRALKDAIEFRGIAEDMCPEFEKITRITELDVHQPEKDSATGHAATPKMVKKLARSAAGQEAPLPMDVRSVPTLRKTLDYLIDDLLQHDGNLPVLHGFLWDRTRAIRRDFTFFSTLAPEELKLQVYVLENIARFHVTALHLLSRKGNKPEEFVEQQELEQLGKTLLSLRDLYDDCASQDIVCENEAEYRAYYLIFHGQDPNIMETLQRSWKPELWRDSDAVRTAVSLVEALQNTVDLHGPLKEGPSLSVSGAHHAYFRMVEDSSVSYTMACFAECHFPTIRRSILRSVARSLSRPKVETKDVTANTLNRYLRFDNVEEAIDFAQLHDLEFEPDEEDPSNPSKQRLVLRHRQQLTHVRLSHQFSQSLVEKKRGARKLPQIIHQTVFEDPTSQPLVGTGEDGLFVSDSQPAAPKPSPFSQASKATAISPLGETATQGSQVTPNPFGSFSNQNMPPIAKHNPFAPTPKADADKPATATAQTVFFPQSKPATGDGGAQPSSSSVTTEAKPNPFGSFSSTQTGSNAATGFSMGVPAKDAVPTSTTGSVLQGDNKTLKKAAFSFPTPESKSTASPNSILGQGTKPTAATEAPSQAAFTPSSFASATTQPTGSQAQAKDSAKPATHSTPSFQSSSQLQKPPLGSSENNVTSKSTLGLGGAGSGAAPTLGSSPFPQPQASNKEAASIIPRPPRDLMGDFSRWFVLGDDGLLEDFRVYMVDNILQNVHREWVEEEKERKRKEEEKRINEEVEAFRVRNLRIKFFYRWKNNARTKRLRSLRQSNREKFFQWHAARREEEREAARKEAEKQAELAKVDRSKEFTELIAKKKKLKRSKPEEDLIASGVLSGVHDQWDQAARIVRNEHGSSIPRPPSSNTSRPSTAGSTTTQKAGGKTQAIRDKLLNKRTESFRSSRLSRSTASPEPAKRARRVSERWTLKAMGITQMPDGTALPENLANDILYHGKNYPGLGTRPRASSYSTSERRQTPSEMAPPERPSFRSSHYGIGPPPTSTPSSPNKRKRLGDEDEVVSAPDDDASALEKPPHKRVMSESEKLVGELRAMRVELEEGASWYRSQTSRLQSEAGSRATTPWDDGT